MHYSQVLNWQGEVRWCDERRHRATCPVVSLAEMVGGEERREEAREKKPLWLAKAKTQWKVRRFHANSILH